MNIGIEFEYWIVDEGGGLASAAELTDVHPAADRELIDELLEVTLPPVDRHDALRRQTATVLAEVIAHADAAGKHLVPLGTPLTANEGPIVTERGKLFERIYREGFAPAKNCAGTHVHFDKGDVADQLTLLTALDPALALVSSSPYYDGRRVAHCARALMYRWHSNAALARYRDLWEYVETPEAWMRRLEEHYAVLEAIARERGVRKAEFEAHVRPDDAVVTPVRLRRRTPTVEWRAPDSALPSQVLRLIADVKTLLEQTDEKAVTVGPPGVHADEITVPPFGELRALSATAIYDGIDSERVRTYLGRMRFDVDQYDPIASRLPGDYEISEGTARRVRLDYADRLREDVSALLD